MGTCVLYWLICRSYTRQTRFDTKIAVQVVKFYSTSSIIFPVVIAKPECSFYGPGSSLASL